MLRKRKSKVQDGGVPGRRRLSDDSFRVGRTIAGDAQKQREEKMARAAERKRRKAKNIVFVIIVVLAVAIVAGLLIHYAVGVIREQEALDRPVAPLEPTVLIIDENAGNNVSRRTNEFVARLENDLDEYNLKIDRVVLPLQKARELDVYIVDRSEYYKLSLDRGSAVQAEDLSRMVLYLDEKELKPGYVDLRIEGRAYYR